MNLAKTYTVQLTLACSFFLINFVNAQVVGPLDVALKHIQEQHREMGLTQTDISSYVVSDQYASKHNGVTHIYLNQTYADIKVNQALININILPDGRVLNMGNRFVADLEKRVNTTKPVIRPEAAIRSVLARFDIPQVNTIRMEEKINDQHYLFSGEGIAEMDIPVKLSYEALPDKSVRLSWQVELYTLQGNNWWNAKVDAVNGQVISHYNQMLKCSFGAPESACTEHDHSADASHVSYNHSSATSSASLGTSGVPNSYNVFAIPLESPSHGGRSLVVDPADPTASPFGWHDTDGQDGPEFTITRGNNVHAYHDIFDFNQSSLDEPDGGAELEFDYPFDITNNRPYTQIEPSVVNLFYWNNVLHDLWYQYGFDEAAGNFQVNNYGKGGEEGDYVRAEGIDGEATNNANFGTGQDGTFARMQMYIWTDSNLPTIDDPASSLEVLNMNSEVTASYGFSRGLFGGPLPSPPIKAKIVLADDGVGTTSDVCEDIVNVAEIAGNIAMIDRGDCQFGTKSQRAENSGAIAVIICNNEAGATFGMQPGRDGGGISIPVVMVSLEDCNELKISLPDLVVNFGGEPLEVPNPGPVGVDGGFDNGIIAHEYAHGISNRLTGGPSTGGCLNRNVNDEQAGEGWSDWFALVMQTTSADSASQRRGIGTYATNQPTTGRGIREFPYSRDMSINSHTYTRRATAAVPHGVGSVWAAMIWDLYWNLVDKYGFSDDLYTGTKGNNIAMQLVLDGLKLQPCNPGFIESRDAIIAADEANNNGENFCLIWETFARRGLGVGAMAGGFESFEPSARCNETVKVFKTAASEVDAGGNLEYKIELFNDTQDTLFGVTVTDQLPEGSEYVDGSATCTATYAEAGNSLSFDVDGMMLPRSSYTCTYQIRVDNAPFSPVLFYDDVELDQGSWSLDHNTGNLDWSRQRTQPFEGDFSWYAQDIDSESDQFLTLSEPFTLPQTDPVLSFYHYYDTETAWDGGVVEISIDNGASWIDLEDQFIQNGYNTTINNNPASAISGQAAFSGISGGYILSLINLDSYAGQEVLLRFRMVTDGAAGGDGWYIDNIRLTGELYRINNEVCLDADGFDEPICDVATTVVLGEFLTSTKNLATDLSISIAPNPTTAQIYVQLSQPFGEAAQARLMGIDGRLIQERRLARGTNRFEMDLSDLAKGVYLLHLQSGQGTLVEKVIVQ